MISDERYKQLMAQVGLHDSPSLLGAFRQLANEVEHGVLERIEDAWHQKNEPHAKLRVVPFYAAGDKIGLCYAGVGEVGLRFLGDRKDVMASYSRPEAERMAASWNACADIPSDQIAKTIQEAFEAKDLYDRGELQESFQSRVHPWLVTCFGDNYIEDKTERIHRFVEEALELAQACGCSKNEALNLLTYVFNRQAGDKQQEVGGVMTTLAALCQTQGLDMHEAGEAELARIWTVVEKVRAKQDAKPSYKDPNAKTELHDAELRGIQRARDMFCVGSVSWNLLNETMQAFDSME